MSEALIRLMTEKRRATKAREGMRVNIAAAERAWKLKVVSDLDSAILPRETSFVPCLFQLKRLNDSGIRYDIMHHLRSGAYRSSCP